MSSPLAELYKTKEFAAAWTNDVPFHVARNILQLRRYRGISQSTLASAMGTSQSAIARMENGHENITLETLQRLANAMDGRFFLSIAPAEFSVPYPDPWWESAARTPWTVCGWVSRQSADCDQLVVGLKRKLEFTSGVPQLLPQTVSIGGR